MFDMGMGVSGKTKAENVRATLADEILAGKLSPGSKLAEEHLAARFGISRTPIREAIKQLEAMGLVECQPHRGAKVIGIQAAHVLETYAVVLAACVELGAMRMDPEMRAEAEEGEDAALSVVPRAVRNPVLAELLASLEARARPFLAGPVPVREALLKGGRGRKAIDELRDTVSRGRRPSKG